MAYWVMFNATDYRYLNAHEMNTELDTATFKKKVNQIAKADELLQSVLMASLKPVETPDGVKQEESRQFELLKEILKLEELMLRIIESEDDCFAVKEINGKNTISYNQLGEEIRSFFSKDMVTYNLYADLFDINPCCKLFIEEFEKIETRTLLWFNPNPHEGAQATCDLLNATVTTIREKFNTFAFRRKTHDFRRSSAKNLASLRRYISRCFEIHPRLLVVRLDLGYKKDAFTGDTFLESLNEAQEHWKKWIRRFKRYTGKAYVGFARKLECGLDKSFHFRVLLLLDGSFVGKGGAITILGGKDWNEKITQGKGIYYNFNSHKKNHGHLGVGLIHAKDQEKLAALDTTACSLVKTDYLIKLIDPDDSRVFSKGDKPRAKLKSVCLRGISSH